MSDLEMKPAGVVTFRSASRYDASFGFDPREIYVIVQAVAELRRINWDTGQTYAVTSLLGNDCTSPDVSKILLLSRRNLLLVLNCGRVEIRDPTQLTRIDALMGEIDWSVTDFAVSKDEKFLALTLRHIKEGDTSVRLLDTDNWTVISKFSDRFSTIQFSPARDLLATVFAKSEVPNSLFTTECGMTFFHVPSGKVAFKWSRRVDEATCPGIAIFLSRKSN